MKLFFIFLILAISAPWMRAQTDEEVAARANTLDLAYAFANDGFKVRDSYFTTTFSDSSKAIIDVSLYAGNDYWFIVGTNSKENTPLLEVFDDKGNMLTSSPYHTQGRAAASFHPKKTGHYFIRIKIADTDEKKPVSVCFLYSYR